MNTNFFHNILNVAIAILGALTAFLLATGCTTLPTGALECSQSWISPTYTSFAVMALGILKSVINVVRDGFGGLFKQQPPVASKTTTVVVAQPSAEAPKVQVTAPGATVTKTP